MPAGCAHRVENLETSLAISANFVNLSNLAVVKQELAINSLIDSRADDLLKQISKYDFPLKMHSKIDHQTFEEFKQWPKDYSDHDY